VRIRTVEAIGLYHDLFASMAHALLSIGCYTGVAVTDGIYNLVGARA
jgi:hypothetical protein